MSLALKVDIFETATFATAWNRTGASKPAVAKAQETSARSCAWNVLILSCDCRAMAPNKAVAGTRAAANDHATHDSSAALRFTFGASAANASYSFECSTFCTVKAQTQFATFCGENRAAWLHASSPKTAKSAASGVFECANAQVMSASSCGLKVETLAAASLETASNNFGASNPAFENAHATLQRSCALNVAIFSTQACQTASNSSLAGNPAVAKAQTVLARFWAMNDSRVARDRAAMDSNNESHSQPTRASPHVAFARALGTQSGACACRFDSTLQSSFCMISTAFGSSPIVPRRAPSRWRHVAKFTWLKSAPRRAKSCSTSPAEAAAVSSLFSSMCDSLVVDRCALTPIFRPRNVELSIFSATESTIASDSMSTKAKPLQVPFIRCSGRRTSRTGPARSNAARRLSALAS
mmetsp:Transcript_1867/g.5570  ORF Transcript_1867/g.5570 Transcript_1867/m.5570 type:complete len:412 (+) Transcript_1867:2643-3878(+)